MTREEELDMAIKALEQEEPSGDLISRQAVEDAMYDATRSMDLNYGQIMEYIDKLPSVKQEPKTGHWIELGCVGNDNYDFECSECHHTDTQSKTVKVNYCWYCGAKMVEQERSEEC